MDVPSFEEMFNQAGLGQGPGAMAPAQPPGLGQQAPTGGGWNDAIAGRSNSLVGMGLGMMGGGWAGGMSGYGQGSKVDEQAASRRQQAQQHAADRAQAQANADRAYALQSAPEIKMVKGVLGEEPYVWDKLKQTWKPLQGSAGGGGVGAGSPEGNYDEQGFDKPYLDAVRGKYGSEVAKSVEDIAAGRMPASGRNLQQLMPLASRYKRDFNAQDYAIHLQAEKSFAPGGKDSDKVRAINQALVHANSAWDMSEKLGGVGVGGPVGDVLNRGYQGYNQATDPQYASDVQNYGRLSVALSNELISASKGGSGSDVVAAHEAAKALNAAKSPAERRGAIQGAIAFLEGAHNALEQKREAGRRSGFETPALVTPENQATFDRIRNYREGAPAAPAPTTSGAGAAQAAPAASVPPPAQRQVGQTYPTPKGPLKWTGTGWVSP